MAPLASVIVKIRRVQFLWLTVNKYKNELDSIEQTTAGHIAAAFGVAVT